MVESLKYFLEEWDKNYKSQVEKINLFNIEKTSKWTNEQKSYFAKVFYHARGHFHEFLWYLGNHCNDKEIKNIVLKNISEELNGSAKSHEQLYIEFGEGVGADIKKESIEQSNYLPFLKEFNLGHVRWLSEHTIEEQFSAFSAYERLDNLDYIYLDKLAESINISNKCRLFFKVHIRVEHFETTENKLNSIWESDKDKIAKAFEFIASHQISMWNQISNTIFSY